MNGATVFLLDSLQTSPKNGLQRFVVCCFYQSHIPRPPSLLVLRVKCMEKTATGDPGRSFENCNGRTVAPFGGSNS